MSWTARDIPDQSGRVAVVTGANGGLGLETARELARAGAHVVMAARDQDKAATARDDLLRTVPEASLEIVELDLASLASVRACADAIVAAHDKVDLLVNNAGLMAMPERRTADGFEMQFGVNHLGHWALTNHLLPHLLAAPAPRVVAVSSTAHHMGRVVDPDNPNMEGNYGPWRAYGQSKLANLHFAIGLDREFRRHAPHAAALAAHPGLTNSDLQARTAREQGGPLARAAHAATRSTGMSPARGALSQLRAATDPNAEGGEFYGPLWVNSGPPVRKPLLRRFDLDRGIRRLWEVSRRETGAPLDVAAAATPA